VKFLDLAVSGSTPAVEAGTVTLLAGGDPKNLRAMRPDLRVYCQTVVLDGTLVLQAFS